MAIFRPPFASCQVYASVANCYLISLAQSGFLALAELVIDVISVAVAVDVVGVSSGGGHVFRAMVCVCA